MDVGGTFTDVVALDPSTGSVVTRKLLTTHGDLVRGVLNAFTALTPDFGAVAGLIHGTTIATNAFLTRKGSRCGLITTRGFRDVVELRRRDRPNTYGLRGSFEPIIPRYLRYEVDERVNARGEVEDLVDPDQVTAVAKQLLSQDVESVVIAFMNSYANPENELAAKRAVETIWPNRFITVSTEVFPGFREFERWVTASANTFVQPVLAVYLDELERGMSSRGFDGRAYVMQSNGGAMSLEQARRSPINTVLSGPAGGVNAAIHISRGAGYRNVISCDMGGTSFDVCLIVDGRATVRRTFDLEYGLPLEVPAADIVSIGAGGGSIAWIDRAGILRVGPQSAGSSPGPACYARGGTAPTVTDAHVALGRIAAGTALGGDEALRIDRTLAVAAIRERVADPLGLGVEHAAQAVLSVANARLAGAVRLVSLERGHDPREFALVMFGGAGPLHCMAIMEELQIPRAIVPFYPGLTSAIGCAYADIRHDLTSSVNRPLDQLTAAEVEAVQRAHAQRGEELIDAERGLGVREVKIIHEADVSYIGQTHTLRVQLKGDTANPHDIASSFAEAYARYFGHSIEAARIWVSNFATTVIGSREAVPATLRPKSTGGRERTSRRVFFGHGWLDTAVVDRLSLTSGERIVGPAVIEQPDSTTAIEPGYLAEVDAELNLILRWAS
jgi:N-methylhydantoinase A